MAEPIHDAPSRSRYPFSSTPDGWYAVATSAEIAPGRVRPLRYFGEDLVLYRTASGEARVTEAHCPHLGAHFGHGGTVEGPRGRPRQDCPAAVGRGREAGGSHGPQGVRPSEAR